jgi:hypothetical protein
MKRLQFSIICFILSFTALAGNNSIYKSHLSERLYDSSGVMQQRINTLKIGGAAIYIGTLIGLYSFEYKNDLHSHFQIKTVNGDWRMGMDATHHATASYHIGRLGFDLLRWAGINETRSTWLGGLSGFFLLSSQEIFDGFDKQWAASASDLAANTMGAALFISQQLAWHNQKIVIKWSYHTTSFPGYSPDHLGSNAFQQMIKDYNGQTFWMSANLKSFAHRDSRMPRWLNIAVGLGATGITGPPVNQPLIRSIPVPAFERQRLFYIAPDIDLSRIRTHSAALKWIFEAIGFLKFPFPAIEFGKQAIKFKPLYF